MLNKKCRKATRGGVLCNTILSILLYPGSRRSEHKTSMDIFILPFKLPSLPSNGFLFRISNKISNAAKCLILNSFLWKTLLSRSCRWHDFHGISYFTITRSISHCCKDLKTYTTVKLQICNSSTGSQCTGTKCYFSKG